VATVHIGKYCTVFCFASARVKIIEEKDVKFIACRWILYNTGLKHVCCMCVCVCVYVRVNTSTVLFKLVFVFGFR
jgi:hypothetical protein